MKPDNTTLRLPIEVRPMQPADIPDYLGFDQESRGYATLIERVNPDPQPQPYVA